MWPPTVVVGAVFSQDGTQMSFAEDQHTDGEFGSGCEHQSLGEAVRSETARTNEPLRFLPLRLSCGLAERAPGLRSFIISNIDGVMIDIPDTTENCDRYPKAAGGTRRPFPQMRGVGLPDCSTHATSPPQWRDRDSQGQGERSRVDRRGHRRVGHRPGTIRPRPARRPRRPEALVRRRGRAGGGATGAG
jgi:hypothetical protein